MEPKFNTSFIPKKSLQTDVGPATDRYVKRRTIHGPGFYVTLLMFTASLVGTVGVFGYSRIVQRNVILKMEEVTKIRDELKQDTMAELIRVDTRLTEAEKLLRGHTVLTPLLGSIERTTVSVVRYISLKYSESTEKVQASLVLKGVSDNYPLVARQFDEYRKDKDDMVLSNLTDLEQDDDANTVKFEANISLDPRATSFASVLEKGTWTSSGSAAPSNAVVPPPASPATVNTAAPSDGTEAVPENQPTF